MAGDPHVAIIAVASSTPFVFCSVMTVGPEGGPYTLYTHPVYTACLGRVYIRFIMCYLKQGVRQLSPLGHKSRLDSMMSYVE